jgi:hypothetical protein
MAGAFGAFATFLVENSQRVAAATRRRMRSVAHEATVRNIEFSLSQPSFMASSMNDLGKSLPLPSSSSVADKQSTEGASYHHEQEGEGAAVARRFRSPSEEQPLVMSYQNGDNLSALPVASEIPTLRPYVTGSSTNLNASTLTPRGSKHIRDDDVENCAGDEDAITDDYGNMKYLDGEYGKHAHGYGGDGASCCELLCGCHCRTQCTRIHSWEDFTDALQEIGRFVLFAIGWEDQKYKYFTILAAVLWALVGIIYGIFYEKWEFQYALRFAVATMAASGNPVPVCEETEGQTDCQLGDYFVTHHLQVESTGPPQSSSFSQSLYINYKQLFVTHSILVHCEF